MIIPNTFNWNMSAQGIVVSENIQTLYLHTLMNQRNLVKESHLMIKHLMMLSTGNHEKIGDHYEKHMLAGMGHFPGTVVLRNVCIPAKGHAVRYCRSFAFLKEKCGM